MGQFEVTKIKAPGAANISLHISEPIIACETRDDDPPGWHRIHPELTKLPSGRLVLTVCRDRDIPDAELLVFTSDDHGRTWRETLNWPSADRRGEHVNTHVVALPDGKLVGLNAVGLFPAEAKGRYILPTWRSGDGGESWGAMQAAAVTFHTDSQPINKYDLLQWYVDLFGGKPNLKPQMPPAVKRMADAFGASRQGFVITDSHVDADGRVLLFAYTANLASGTRGKHETVVLESTDGCESWQHIARPGPWEDRLDSEYFLKHRTDGLCEPAVTQIGEDELLCVMRLGSRHPLYQSRSSDGGATWTSAMGMPVYGILPRLVTLDDGLVLLATGRPDATLSVSSDGGYRWPVTYRFLEDGKPEDASTRNNTMIKIGPQRVLYMYDHGGYHKLHERFEGRPRIVGHIIDVSSE